MGLSDMSQVPEEILICDMAIYKNSTFDINTNMQQRHVT